MRSTAETELKILNSLTPHIYHIPMERKSMVLELPKIVDVEKRKMNEGEWNEINSILDSPFFFFL